MSFYDMHCHLDFAPNAAKAAAQLDALGVGAFAVGVLPNASAGGTSPGGITPAPLLELQKRTVTSPASASLVKWGVGLHPWWVADGRAGEVELQALLAAIESNTYIGEVGLDFGKTHGYEREAQLQAFEAIAMTCAATGGRVLSIHAVHAAHVALDILEASGALNACTCIFHWFSDSGEAFTRAARAGCYFSVGALMLRSARGREYARQIPPARLLLETDEPPQGHVYDVVAMQAQLAETCETIARLKAVDAQELAATIAATSKNLLTRA